MPSHGSFKVLNDPCDGIFQYFERPDDSPVIRDEMVYIGTTQNRVENVFRLVEVHDTKGNVLRLITNRFDLSTNEISDVYRSC